MRLWPTGISLYSTDEEWNAKAWKHLTKHYKRFESFHQGEVRRRFNRHGTEWKPRAIGYLARDIGRNGL